MNWFVKYMLIPGLTLGATIGATTGVTLHLNNKKHKNDYNLGYSNALSDKAYYESQLSEFDKLRNEYINQIAELVAKNEELTTQNTQKERQITSLTADNEQKASRISVLESENNEYQSTIENLRAEKTTLESRVAELQKSETDKTSEIAKLNIQISNLQQQITSYQTLIATNTQTISTLNETIKTQQAQITKLQEDLKQLTMSSKEYTDKIAELQKTVEYLESYVNGTLGDQQVSVKFMFDNSLYNLQVLNKGSYASVTDPQSTPYVKFNYWMKDGYQVNLAETPISENTTFVANVTYSYDVKFMNGEQQMKAEIVESGHYVTKPEQDPTKDGYEFDGWTLNGVDVVDPAQTEITGTTIFTAKFTKLHNVKFESGIEHDETQQVRDGERPTAYSSAEMQREGYEFDGWTLNDRIVTPEEIDIYNDTTFVAKWTQVHTVTYNVDDQQTTEKVRHGEHVKNVPSTVRDGYDFDGWFVVDSKVDDINNYEINEDTTFNAKFTQVHTVTYDVNGEQTTEKVRHGEHVKNVPSTIKDGYDFDGWYFDSQKIDDINNYVVNADTVFTAKFTQIHTVTYSVNGQQTTEKVRHGEYVKNVPETARDNYDFDGWYADGHKVDDINSYDINSDVTFTAKYTRLYSVKFKCDGSVIAEQKVRDGGHIQHISEEPPTVVGRIFKGWDYNGYDATKNVTRDLDIYANFEYTVEGKHEFTFKIGSDECKVVLNVTGNNVQVLSSSSNNISTISYSSWEYFGDGKQNASLLMIYFKYQGKTYCYGVTYSVGSNLWNCNIISVNGTPYYDLGLDRNTWDYYLSGKHIFE